ncbi:MAG TPA: hypothetical protein VG269_26690 [Tepidisphaeraceae bacterium]|jgi:hypothetical protein|nr:hypothetical protein [Tepidisphaeraceae bacterium]
MSYRRYTFAFVSWDWARLLGHAVVEMTDMQMADALWVHQEGLDQLRRRGPKPTPADTHVCVCLGEPTEQQMIEGLPDMRRQAQAGTVRKVESWHHD